VLADQAVRDRLLGDLERTFFVEAGAGTGKTTIIVERIVNLVAAGRVRLEQLAAITFTEAAAAELRDRVREGLERAAAERAAPLERERCRQAVEAIDLAAIQTIHAFAAGLLRSYPLEAGLPPGFATLDEVQQRLAFEERFRAWLWGAALERPVREVLRRALLLGLTERQLRDLAAALDGQHDLLGPTTSWPAPPPEAALATARALGPRLSGLRAWIGCARDGEADPLAQVVLRAQPAAERLAGAGAEEQALLALGDLEDLKTTVGSQQRWDRLPDGRNACAALKAELTQIKAEAVDTLQSHRQAVFAELLAMLRDFVLEAVADRRRTGTASFQDLLAWARDLLRDQPSVRRRAQLRYRRIFVDEFQDTDPLQAELVFYLAAAPDQPPPADWRDLRLEPGKLFLVGDPKQSIYRFRRADIGIYDGLLRRLSAECERLVQNFRSVRPLIEFVNHHFAHQMVAQAGLQPPYVPLEARWERFEDGARCGLYRVGGDLGPANAAAVADREAEALAGAARSMIGRALVSEPDAAGGRRLRFAQARDIAILLRTRTHLRRLERALERASLPYRVESGRLLLQTQEVRDLLACLRAIDDPSDQVALVGALRSPAYACGDPDLLRWVEAGGRLSHESPGDGPDGPVKRALANLAEFHRQRQLLSPPALIEAFIADRLLVPAALGEPRPREAWRRLRYVVARARDFTAAGRQTLRAFLAWLGDLERAEARDVESAETEPDEDAVRILTVHGAKGLEFPIVLLAGLGSAGGGRNAGVEVIADRERGSLACRVGQDWKTADFDSAQAHEQQLAAAEAIRLLYVAATRARDHLVLSLHRSARQANSPAALIERRLTSFPGDCFELAPEPDRPAGGPTGLGHPGEPPAELTDCSPAAESAWRANRAELVAQLAAPRLVELTPGEQDEVAAATGGQAALIRAVRALLRRGQADGLDAAQHPAAAELAQAIRASPSYQQAVAHPSCRRDLPLLAIVDGALVDVTIDLLYRLPAGWVLIIYDLDGSRARSELSDQAEPLARAFETVTGQPVQEVEFIAAMARPATGRAAPLGGGRERQRSGQADRTTGSGGAGRSG
jgi:ATP-dependent helicase/nuclease subunit A